MRAIIKPGRAVGKISAPPSKSAAHRLLICAAMANGVSSVHGVSDCDDVRATLDCLCALGVKYEKTGCDYKIFGIDAFKSNPKEPLYCRESGSTLRMMIPIAALSGNRTSFTAEPGLLNRPMTVYEELFSERKLCFERFENGYTVKGPLRDGIYTVRGDVSSQFISGLIFALAACKGQSEIHILPPIESKSYILMTLNALAEFGANAYFSDNETVVISGGGYSPSDVFVDGDFSGTAFTDALGLLGGEVEISGLSDNSPQGDKIYREFYHLLKSGSPKIDITDCPDLAPILFALSTAMNGAEFTGTARLKFKESDRAAAMAAELSKLGAEILVAENSVTVKKSELHAPTSPILSHGDHRIVMALAVLLTLVGGEIVGCEAVSKSYPRFFEDLKKLNIDVKIYE